MARHRRALGYWGVMLALYLSLWLGATLAPPPWLHATMLFAHLASIIIGLGAAVFLEYNGLLWMMRRRTLADLRHTERSVSPLAWLGIIGLFASGAFLQPNLEDPLTVIKMAAVLLVAMNGIAMTRLTEELARLPAHVPFATIPPRVRLWCVWSAVVSQAGWWTAVVIGMLNTAVR
ncbi:hypothetical protein GCM10009777_06670 [Microbacterium pumilum]|uniref:DUF2269 family protein n=2 Tax=Microbacterium pumilum TaxID=344165 RepID=A0ABP5D9Z7_9MICO